MRDLILLVLALSLPARSFGADLDQKLDAQLKRYQAVQDAVVERFSKPGGAFSRSEWEKLLDPGAEQRLTSADREKLKARHAELAEQARKKSASESKIDFDSFRKQPEQVKNFCTQVPKGGMLHVHPQGTLNGATVEKFLKRSNPVIGSNLAYSAQATGSPRADFLKEIASKHFNDLSPSEQKRVLGVFCIPDSTPVIPFKQFEGYFSVVKAAMAGAGAEFDPEYEAYLEFLERAKEEGVTYVEFTKYFSMSPDMNAKLEKWAKSLEKSTGVKVGWNISFSRTDTPDFLSSNAENLIGLVSKTPSSAITGVDVVGNEENLPTLESVQAYLGTVYASARSNKPGAQILHRTAHSGELGDVRNVRDALLLGAERIGHGVRLQDDPVTLEYARRNRVPIEANLVSNYRLGAVKDLREHPFVKYLRLGLRVSLSTDDEGILATDMNNECRVAISQTDLNYAEFKQMAFNSIETSFAPPNERERLLTDLQARFVKFEQSFKQSSP